MCSDLGVQNALVIIGYSLTILKIVIPLILIIKGFIMFFNAILEPNMDLKDTWKSFLSRLFIGAILNFYTSMLDKDDKEFLIV